MQRYKFSIVKVLALMVFSWCVLINSSFARLNKDKYTTEDATITLSSVDDPDGDGDNMGANYFPLTRVDKTRT